MLIERGAGPGSFIEALKIIEPLAAVVPDKPSFHVVVVSLPNFGFSDRVRTRGFGIPQYAEACHKVMMALGYERYGMYGFVPVGRGVWTAVLVFFISFIY